MESRSTRRLVLAPFPLQGHINPMIHLASILRRKGFPITVAHPELNFPDPSHHPDFEFAMLPCGRASPGDPSPPDIVNILFKVNNDCREPFRGLLSKMIEEGDVPCVIYDALLYFPKEVTNQLSLPSMRLHTSSATSCLAHNMLPELRDRCLIPPEDSTLSNPIPEIDHLRFKDLPIRDFNHIDAVLKSFSAVNPIGSSSAIIWNAMEFLEPASVAQLQKLYGVPIFAIGPLHKLSPSCSSSASLLKKDMSCMEWLNKKAPNSVIYISLGSIASMTDDQVVEMAWGLANSKQPFLWVLRPGSIRESKLSELLESGLKEEIGERGRIIEWAPQREVLTHDAVGGFWSHCGWNSAVESIAEGVPLICQLSFADQITNARFLSWVWKVGMEMEGEFERREIERTVRLLMTDEEGRELRQRATKLREKVEGCIKVGGASSNSLNELINHISSL